MRRNIAVSFAVLLLTFPVVVAARAQDPASMAAQQALQATEQAQQQAMAAAQQAQQSALQANQQALQNAQDAAAFPAVGYTGYPLFSLKPGFYPGPVTVKLRSRTHRARIFYTLDGWTPTAASIPYTGPITLDRSATVQAIAVASHALPSRIAVATYQLAAPPPTAPAPSILPPLTASQPLPVGTLVLLRFAEPLDSESAFVGQKVSLTLAQDLVVGGRLFAPAGTPALATVTEADPAGRGHQPGILAFALQSLTLHGVEVPLTGTRTREGAQPGNGAAALFLIPVAGPFTLLKHGPPAEIDAGTEVEGTVAATATIPPASTPAP